MKRYAKTALKAIGITAAICLVLRLLMFVGGVVRIGVEHSREIRLVEQMEETVEPFVPLFADAVAPWYPKAEETRTFDVSVGAKTFCEMTVKLLVSGDGMSNDVPMEDVTRALHARWEETGLMQQLPETTTVHVAVYGMDLLHSIELCYRLDTVTVQWDGKLIGTFVPHSEERAADDPSV